MNRLPLKLTFALAGLAACAVPVRVHADATNGGSARIAQNFEYTPYNGQNNTPNLPPPQDAYTPSHPAGSPGSGDAYTGPPAAGAAAPAYRGAQRQGDDPDADRGGGSSGDAYSPPPRSTASSGDAYSPAQNGATRGAPYSASEGDAYSPPPPPQGDAYSPRQGDAYAPPGGGAPASRGDVGPSDAAGGLPRVEVQAAAPDDGLPYSVREHDARRAAIEGWKGKVADRFGPDFSHWRVAADKHVDCHPDRRDGIICTASAQPVRGLGQGPGADDRE